MKYLLFVPATVLAFTTSIPARSKAPVSAPSAPVAEQPTRATEKPEEITYADFEASFPGGMTGLLSHINKNMHYPKAAMEKKIQGICLLAATLKKDGTIGDITVKKSLSPECDAEAIRVMKTLPKCKPMIKDGKAVEAAFCLPFRFRIQ